MSRRFQILAGVLGYLGERAQVSGRLVNLGEGAQVSGRVWVSRGGCSSVWAFLGILARELMCAGVLLILARVLKCLGVLGYLEYDQVETDSC